MDTPKADDIPLEVWVRAYEIQNNILSGKGGAAYVARVLGVEQRQYEKLKERVAQLEAILRFFNCIDFDNFTEHDELLLEDTIRRLTAS